jgi:hypothetical protein
LGGEAAKASRRLLALLVAGALLAFAGVAEAQQVPVLQPSAKIDGPSADIGGLTGLSVARDGTGGLVYGKSVAGATQVFVSRLVGGSFMPAEQIDASLGAGGSSQPVIAAGDGGLLLIAFVNLGKLYVVTRPSASAPFSAPQPLAGSASDPAIALSIHGKGYLAFTTAGGGGHDVRAAYYNAGQWSVVDAPLDATPANDAGTGAARPKVAAAGDGVGIFVWGEAGHVFSRRVWATSPSVVYEQADVPSLNGFTEVSADLPSIAGGDDDSYANVVFHEVMTNGSATHSRVLVRRLRASVFEGVVEADGLTSASAEGGVQPRIAMSQAQHGFITSAGEYSNQLSAALLGDGGLVSAVMRVDTLFNSALPYAAPATTGLFSGLIAWQTDPGLLGPREIRARFYDGSSFGPELIASSPALGATNAASGLAAAGDRAGDVAMAWVQGSGSSKRIVAAQLYYPPGSFGSVPQPRYGRDARPTFAWSAAREQWGPAAYQVAVDGVQIGQTTSTSFRAPAPVPQGPHAWQVTAINQAGLTTPARAGTLWIDTIAPVVQFTLTGAHRAGSVLHLAVRYSDAPPPLAPAATSGVATVLVKWGDGATSTIRHRTSHAYRRPGPYRLTVTVTDRAGNSKVLVRRVRIAARQR